MAEGGAKPGLLTPMRCSASVGSRPGSNRWGERAAYIHGQFRVTHVVNLEPATRCRGNCPWLGVRDMGSCHNVTAPRHVPLDVPLALVFSHGGRYFLYQSVRAAVTKYHRPVSLNNGHLLLVVLAARSSASRCQWIHFLMRALFLASRWPPSHRVLSWPFFGALTQRDRGSAPPHCIRPLTPS